MSQVARQARLTHRANIRAELARSQHGLGPSCTAETSHSATPPAQRTDDWILAAEPQPYRQLALRPSAAAGTLREALGDDQVLHLINSHPEGIGIVDLGNEMGVDWRGLVGSTDRLVNHGDIEHVQQLFYPVAE